MCVRHTERGGEGDQEHLNMERRREAEKVSSCVCIKEREREYHEYLNVERGREVERASACMCIKERERG